LSSALETILMCKLKDWCILFIYNLKSEWVWSWS